MIKRIVLGLSITMLLASSAAFAQQDAAGGGEAAAVDPALFEQGQQLYEENCAACHQSGGAGVPPNFPALNANERLKDLALVVANIHRGKGAMPAFPDLTADQLAALATYIRDAWGNDFGGATTQEVTAILGGLQDVGPQASVWDGVFTKEQAARGAQVHAGVCAKCHGARGNGAGEPDQPNAPAIAREPLIRNWGGQSLATLYEYVKKTMPPDNPGSRSDQEYIDSVAQMLALSNMPAGEQELVPDPEALAGIVIQPKP